MKHKSILFVTTISRTVEAFLFPHIDYFVKKGFRVGVASNMDVHHLHSLEKIGVTLHHVPFSRSVLNKGNLASYKIIQSVLPQYQLLHVHTPIASFITRMASSKHHDVIYMAHGFHFNENSSCLTNLIYRLCEAIAGFKTTKLVVTNTEDLAAAQKIITKKKIHYVHGVGLNVNEYDKQHFSAEDLLRMKASLGIEMNRKVITHVAEFNENKRQIDIVNACVLLKQRMDNFTIVLIGQGDHFDRIQQQIRDRQLDKYMMCLGFRKDVPDILSMTDIGLLISIREGLPRSIMEMMAMKIPVIATDIRGNRDLVFNGETGYLVPIKDPEQIADKCFYLLNDDNKIKTFGENARKVVEDQFSIEKVLHEMELIYKELYKKSDNTFS